MNRREPLHFSLAFILLATVLACGDDPIPMADRGHPDGGSLSDLRPSPERRADSKVPTPDAAKKADQGPDQAQGPCPLPGPPSKYTPGLSYWGRKDYIQYLAGDLPVVLSAPHGGYLKPTEIPDRTTGVLGGDSNSLEYTMEAAHYLYKMTGLRPHVIINRLHRIKLDANREIVEACQGSVWAEQAWNEYHQFIEAARTWVTGRCGRGHYFDLHTNAHAEHWIELGFLLGTTDLALNDTLLNDLIYVKKSSVRAMASLAGAKLAEIVRGPYSLGGLLMSHGYTSVPSPVHLHPAGGGYFNGGYNTARHGSRDGGTIDGTQVEVYSGFMDTEDKRDDLSYQLARSIREFMERHYPFTLKVPWSPPKNDRCHSAQLLTLNLAGTATVVGTTLGADNEFGTQVTCGNSFALDGPQVYYRILLQGGKLYDVILKADFPARYYLFGDTCTPALISSGCQTSGLSGVLVTSNVEHKVTVTIPKTGLYTLAVDSRSSPNYGPFVLTIKSSP